MLLETVPLLVRVFDPEDDKHLAFTTRSDVIVPIFGSLYIDADQATIYYRNRELKLAEAIEWVDREADKDLWIIVSGRVKAIGKTSEHTPSRKTYIDDPSSWTYHIDADDLWLLDRYALHRSPSRDEMNLMDTPANRAAARETMQFLQQVGGPEFLTQSRRPEAESSVVKALLAQPEYTGWKHLQPTQDFLLQSITSPTGESVQLAELMLEGDLAKRLGALLCSSGLCGEEPIGGYAWKSLEDVVVEVEWNLGIR